jgi:hypothetical protein
MTERKVDVMDRAGKVLHTYPITLTVTNPMPRDADYEKAALTPSSRIGGFFRTALVVDQRVGRKGLHYRGCLDIALMSILLGSRGPVRVRALAARS